MGKILTLQELKFMDDKTDKFLGILFGIAIGAIIVYAILKKPQQQIQSNNNMLSTNVCSTTAVDQHVPTSWSQHVHDNYSLIDLENRLNVRLSNLEQRLDQKLNQNIPQTTNIDSKQSSQTIQHTMQPYQSQSQKSNMVQIMENEEDWELKKDDKGKIIGVGVHRKLYSTDK